MVSDVVLEHFRADHVLAEAILWKRQKCPLPPPAAIGGTGEAPKRRFINEDFLN
jgi:hypothetical protein